MVSLSRISPTGVEQDPDGVRRGQPARMKVYRGRLRVCSTIEFVWLIFDRVFDGDDVIAAPGVDQVEQRCEGRGLPTSGGTREQRETLPSFGQLGKRRGQVQRFERWNLRGQQTNAGRQRSALMVEVGSEPPDRTALETKIQRLVGFQLG